MIIAVDFDDTLQVDGKPNLKLMADLVNAQRNGHAVILWSCRTGQRLADAVRYCAEHGLRFNCVNDNHISVIKKLGYNSRKIYADIYIDDKAMNYGKKLSDN